MYSEPRTSSFIIFYVVIVITIIVIIFVYACMNIIISRW
jgi:hypothetical protein